MKILDELFSRQDMEYAAFQRKLTPTVEGQKIIGVRVPEVRKIAAEFFRENSYDDFLKSLPHQYYEENMLHGLLISNFKDYERCIFEVEKFLPYVDNWAVCDTLSPKIFAKNKKSVLEKIKQWSKSKCTYVCRFGLATLMRYFLDEDFKEEYLEIPCTVLSEEYYVNMMIAWFYATALAKQWKAAVVYLEQKKLGKWVHNKTIQKACESFRISDEQKKYLRTLKLV